MSSQSVLALDGEGIEVIRLLDLFCGAGGAAMGYHRAGFDVIGVDIKPQLHYPFQFIQADALDFPLDGYDVIHASPPCQGYSRMRHLPWLQGKDYPLLIDVIRWRLVMSGCKWVIENVEDAPMPTAIILCGLSFGLPLYRHRRFESSDKITVPLHQKHEMVITGGRLLKSRARIPTWERATGLPAAMGCEWMTQHEAGQAIPPVYTEWIGRQFMEVLSCNPS